MAEVFRNCGINGDRTYEVGPVIHIVLGGKMTADEFATRLGVQKLPEALARMCGRAETALLIDGQQRGSSVLETWSINPNLDFQTFNDERFARWEDRRPIGSVRSGKKKVPVYQADPTPDDAGSHQ